MRIKLSPQRRSIPAVDFRISDGFTDGFMSLTPDDTSSDMKTLWESDRIVLMMMAPYISYFLSNQEEIHVRMCVLEVCSNGDY